MYSKKILQLYFFCVLSYFLGGGVSSPDVGKPSHLGETAKNKHDHKHSSILYFFIFILYFIFNWKLNMKWMIMKMKNPNRNIMKMKNKLENWNMKNENGKMNMKWMKMKWLVYSCIPWHDQWWLQSQQLQRCSWRSWSPHNYIYL